jgi:Uma2 family endonuclease
MTTLTTAKWTLDDYHRMIDVGILVDRRVELLYGEIVEIAPEGTPHSYYSDESATCLRTLLGNRARVREAKPTRYPTTQNPTWRSLNRSEPFTWSITPIQKTSSG